MSASRSRKTPLPAVSAPEPVPPSPATCQNCEFWARLDREVGECREGPPTHPSNEFHSAGRLHVYRLTASSLPACGRFQARKV